MIFLGLWLAISGYTVLYLGWTSWSTPIGKAGPSLACVLANRQRKATGPDGTPYLTCGPGAGPKTVGTTPSGSGAPIGKFPGGQLTAGPTAAQLNAIHRQRTS